MRTNLQFAKVGNPVRTILVTSPAPGEGKSTTACNLAIAFAQTGKKVLLVDADLRRPTLDAKFSVHKEPGLSELLAGSIKLSAAVQPTKVENLHVMVSGEIPSNPAEILGSEAMRDFVDAASKTYEVVLFDSSPILAVTDPAVISTMVDGTVIVVASGKTRLQDLDQAAELLEGVGGKVLGVVMNNFRSAPGIRTLVPAGADVTGTATDRSTTARSTTVKGRRRKPGRTLRERNPPDDLDTSKGL